MDIVQKVTQVVRNTQIADFTPGDTVNVFVKVREGEKERTQVYRGVVTKLQGRGVSRSFTVRKVSAGVGVERTFPFASPAVEKVEVLTIGHVRRARLYYLRDRAGKAAKIQSDLFPMAAATTGASSGGRAGARSAGPTGGENPTNPTVSSSAVAAGDGDPSGSEKI